MRTLVLGLLLAPLVVLPAPPPAGAREPLSSKEEMRFGVEAAKLGLWREAVFRWERALRSDPENARLRNNLAVAYEGLGRFEEALREYKEAVRLDPDSKEIRNNYEAFQESHAPRQTDEAADAASQPPAGDGP
jgi:Tfp pilus assembly protein PilF